MHANNGVKKMAFDPMNLDSFLEYGFILVLFAGVIAYIAWRLIQEWIVH